MIHHLEAMSNGAPSADRPRGLAPSLFGPTGAGWQGLADRLCPMLAARRATVRRGIAVMLDRPGGNEPDGTISDRPFLLAKDTPWSDKLCDARALAGTLGQILHASGGPIVMYIGCPRQDEPDPVLISMARIGLVHGVVFDATAHAPRELVRAQWDAYRAAGCWIGYEAVPNYSRPDLYRDPAMTLCSLMHEWVDRQFQLAPLPPHPNRNVHRDAVSSQILLLDPRDNAAKATELAREFSVFVNLLSDAWKGRALPDADGAAASPTGAGTTGGAAGDDDDDDARG